MTGGGDGESCCLLSDVSDEADSSGVVGGTKLADEGRYCSMRRCVAMSISGSGGGRSGMSNRWIEAVGKTHGWMLARFPLADAVRAAAIFATAM